MIANWENTATTMKLTGWKECKAYRFRILTIAEDDGSFSAVVLNLPGIGSCGDTEEEAMENAKEAIRSALESYAASNDPIPWKDACSVKSSSWANAKWITLDA